MCAAEKGVHDWLGELMAKVTSVMRMNYDDVRYEVSVPGDSFFLSSTYYVSIVEKLGARQDGGRTVVVKRSPQNERIREVIRSDVQFHNEILFYESYAERSEDFPRCVYYEGEETGEPVLVLENVKGRGYEICPWKYDVPLEYTLAAMREIGRFHGRGYVMKERQREKFRGILNQIQETRFDGTPNSEFRQLIDLTASRAVEYLRKRGYDGEFCDRMERHLENAFDNVMMKSAEPVEPLATLCHGDFTLNNTLFRKDKDGAKAMLIDFALMRYGSPAIDLSTYLCLHCPYDFKKENFRNIFNAYHGALKGYLEENGLWDSSKYSYECLYDDYKERALFGFVIASFYLSTVMDKNPMQLEDCVKMDVRESALLTREAGGDEISKILADMLLDLRKLRCLENIV